MSNFKKSVDTSTVGRSSTRVTPLAATRRASCCARWRGHRLLIDLAATFADYAQPANPAAAHSRSLRPLIERDDVHRDHALTEWRLGAQRCGVALDLRGVRTRDAKLTLELGSGAGELYNLREDPHECVNRFDDPTHRGLRDELTQRLLSRPADMHDPLPDPVGPA